jgi:pimeloyl-ACP methyl ester carboxylesterase
VSGSSTGLAHQIAGDGPPVVLLNGGMMTFASWEPITSRLRERFRVLTFDFRGQLLSQGEGPADLAGHAADLAALMGEVGWKSAHLVGTSFGAEVALELAASRPESARSVIAITAMDRSTPAFDAGGSELRSVLPEIDRPGARERFWDLMVAAVYSASFREREAAMLDARRTQLALLPPAWFSGVDRLLAAIDSFDLTSRLGAVRCPALVVLAGDDQVMDPARSTELAAALHAEIAIHPTAGHALVAEDPAWLAGVVLDFLERQEGSRT